MSPNTQESNVLIALTKTDFPRTLDALHAETGYPVPSLRRCISRLRAMRPGKVVDIPRNEVTGEYRLVFAELSESATMG